ncbi:MAG: gliding motility-associated C-terminal domain-containing protein, partial [Bacteroidia bacterium]
NDIFLPKGYKIERLTMLIFNRWGELIFQSNDVNVGWDGKTKSNIFAQDGLYTCLIEALDVYENKYKYKGAVFLFK